MNKKIYLSWFKGEDVEDVIKLIEAKGYIRVPTPEIVEALNILHSGLTIEQCVLEKPESV